jgi:hypothetical protein
MYTNVIKIVQYIKVFAVKHRILLLFSYIQYSTISIDIMLYAGKLDAS